MRQFLRIIGLGALIGVGMFVAIWLGRYAASVAHAETIETALPARALDAPASYDPFAPLRVKEGDMLPELRCMHRTDFNATVDTHGGSKVVPMTAAQAMFWRGYYAALPFVETVYPIGDNVIYAVKPVPGEHGDATLRGVVAFTVGDAMVCNAIPVTDAALQALFRAGGAPPAAF